MSPSPASPKENKPVHNGKNSKTKAAPSQANVSLNHLRQKVTGTQVPKTDTVNLPQNRARALFAAAARKA